METEDVRRLIVLLLSSHFFRLWLKINILAKNLVDILQPVKYNLPILGPLPVIARSGAVARQSQSKPRVRFLTSFGTGSAISWGGIASLTLAMTKGW